MGVHLEAQGVRFQQANVTWMSCGVFFTNIQLLSVLARNRRMEFQFHLVARRKYLSTSLHKG